MSTCDPNNCNCVKSINGILPVYEGNITITDSFYAPITKSVQEAVLKDIPYESYKEIWGLFHCVTPTGTVIKLPKSETDYIPVEQITLRNGESVQITRHREGTVYYWTVSDIMTVNESKLLFYAPLTTTKNAAYAWDNVDLAPAAPGTGTIQNGEYYNTNAGNHCRWKSAIPMGKNLTFSGYATCTDTGYRWNFAFGTTVVATDAPNYTGLQIAFLTGDSTCIESAGGQHWINNKNYKAQLNTKVFYSYTVHRMPDGHIDRIKLYINGELITDRTGSSDYSRLWKGFVNNYFSLGFPCAWDNLVGKVSQFTCYEELTDAEVKALYQRGGIPF